jgi:NitT/TauT family transport system substrate-binding protein
VTWNPPLQQARNAKGAKMIFDSSQIPGEIIDMMVVKSNSARDAAQGARRRVVRGDEIMSGGDKAGNDSLEAMAKAPARRSPNSRRSCRPPRSSRRPPTRRSSQPAPT